MNKQSKTRGLSYLIFLLAFLGLGAIGGGGTLIVSPTGKLIGLPLSLLEQSPFKSFLIPGLILFAVLGLAPCLLIIALLKKPESCFAERLNCFSDMHWAWSYCVYISFGLIIWIQVEMVFIQAVSWLHTFYIVLALVMLFITLKPSMRQLYKRQVSKI